MEGERVGHYRYVQEKKSYTSDLRGLSVGKKANAQAGVALHCASNVRGDGQAQRAVCALNGKLLLLKGA
jgi:hypothetical protein